MTKTLHVIQTITHTMKTGAMSQSADSSTRVLPDSGSRVPFCIKNFTRPGVPTATWQPPLSVLLFSATGTPPTRVATARLGMSLPSRIRVCYIVGGNQTIHDPPIHGRFRARQVAQSNRSRNRINSDPRNTATTINGTADTIWVRRGTRSIMLEC